MSHKEMNGDGGSFDHARASRATGILEKCFSKMAEGMDEGPERDNVEKIAAACADLSDCHKCADADKVAKAMGMGDALVPDFVSAIIPDAPQSVRPILRAGQRDFGEFEKADGPFAEMFKVE